MINNLPKLSEIPSQAPDTSVKRVFIKRRNSTGDYAAYIGSRQIEVDLDRKELIDLVKRNYPNAQIIEK